MRRLLSETYCCIPVLYRETVKKSNPSSLKIGENSI
jgi:hypothetical protein